MSSECAFFQDLARVQTDALPKITAEGQFPSLPSLERLKHFRRQEEILPKAEDSRGAVHGRAKLVKAPLVAAVDNDRHHAPVGAAARG